MIFFVSCLSGLAWCWCSLKLLIFNRGTAQPSSEWLEAPSNAPTQQTGPSEICFQGYFPLSQSPFWPRTDRVGLWDIHLGYSDCHHCWAFCCLRGWTEDRCDLVEGAGGGRGRPGFVAAVPLVAGQIAYIWEDNGCMVPFITLGQDPPSQQQHR